MIVSLVMISEIAQSYCWNGKCIFLVLIIPAVAQYV